MEAVGSPPWREALMYRKLGSIAILLVLALCTAGAARALPVDPEAAETPSGTRILGMWSRFLDWLGRITEGEDGLTALWLEGSHCDPNGACVPH